MENLHGHETGNGGYSQGDTYGRWRLWEAERRRPARVRLVEVVGAQRYRTKVKRRKAVKAGKLARGSESLYPLEVLSVVATRSLRSLLVLPKAVCRVPHKR